MDSLFGLAKMFTLRAATRGPTQLVKASEQASSALTYTFFISGAQSASAESAGMISQQNKNEEK
jgi:hypothetical protein